jgi:hypothetical protein
LERRILIYTIVIWNGISVDKVKKRSKDSRLHVIDVDDAMSIVSLISPKSSGLNTWSSRSQHVSVSMEQLVAHAKCHIRGLPILEHVCQVILQGRLGYYNGGCIFCPMRHDCQNTPDCEAVTDERWHAALLGLLKKHRVFRLRNAPRFHYE